METKTKKEILEYLSKNSGYRLTYLETLNDDELLAMYKILQIYPASFFRIN